MLETKVLKVYASDKTKDGKKFVTRDGRPYIKVAIKVDYPRYDGKYLSCLSFKEDDPVRHLKEGQDVKIIVEENGDYVNFRLPSKDDLIEERITILEKNIKWIVEQLGKEPVKEAIDLDKAPSQEDIPF